MKKTMQIDGHTWQLMDVPDDIPEGIPHGVNIVVLDRGFVYIGYVYIDDQFCYIREARNIRMWGTTKGLGELVNGPTAKTLSDEVGMVMAPLRAVISIIAASAEKWKL